MKQKKDLAKIALTAFILASAVPVQGQADSQFEVAGTYLAGGCAAHGCPGVTPPSKAPNGDNADKRNEAYDTRSSTYQTNPSNRDTATLTEAQFLDLLSPQGKAIYQSLDSEGKALALQLASQDSYRDKNLAVKEAQRRMNERRGGLRNR